MKLILELLIICAYFGRQVRSRIESSDINVVDSITFEQDQPLYLTPLLEKNKISQAQEQSRVNPDIGNTTSYSGYFTVNKTCESNLFFWFFPAQSNWEEAPVVLWLEGGPGSTLGIGLFENVGPLTYESELGRRQYSWNVKNNLLFIDQPVGTGYSFTGNGCYADNQSVVGNNLYSAVQQFFQLFPELVNNKFFIAGQSYAGHFIPALGYTIHKNNPSATMKVNLNGMMISNGWMDAMYQSDMSSYLYQLGLIDEEGRDNFFEAQEKFFQHMMREEIDDAYYKHLSLMVHMYRTYVGKVSVYNYLKDNYNLSNPFEEFIQMPHVRKAIHVGNMNFTSMSSEVSNHLALDLVYSVKPWIEELLEHYFIVFYTGQLDIICGYPMIANFLKALNWTGKDDFKNATRHKWCVGDRQAGYFKGGHNLYDVLVRNAGHAVAHDQPLWAYILGNSVTSGTQDNPLHALSKC